MGEDGLGFAKKHNLVADKIPRQVAATSPGLYRPAQGYLGCALRHPFTGPLLQESGQSASDLDLVIIAEGLPENFLDRPRVTLDLLPRRVPIEALCYTHAEFFRHAGHPYT
jgi:hypothetical protein